MELKSKLIFSLLLLISAALPVAAQSIDDDDLSIFFGSYPQTGAWMAMDGSNTGFFLDIQNGILAGAYFGFNADGENVWLTFNGPLQSTFTSALDQDWSLNAPLTQGFGGGCILNCADADSLERNSTQVGEIVLDFAGRSSATFRINDGEPIAIVPLYFGTSAIFSDGADGLRAQADLQGTWVVASGSMQADEQGDVQALSLADDAALIEIGEQEVITRNPGMIQLPQDVERVTRSPIISDPQDLFPANAFIQCTYFQQTTLPARDPLIECAVFSDEVTIPEIAINRETSVELMSDSRFVILITTVAQPDDGVIRPVTRLEGFRIGYD